MASEPADVKATLLVALSYPLHGAACPRHDPKCLPYQFQIWAMMVNEIHCLNVCPRTKSFKNKRPRQMESKLKTRPLPRTRGITG